MCNQTRGSLAAMSFVPEVRLLLFLNCSVITQIKLISVTSCYSHFYCQTFDSLQCLKATYINIYQVFSLDHLWLKVGMQMTHRDSCVHISQQHHNLWKGKLSACICSFTTHLLCRAHIHQASMQAVCCFTREAKRWPCKCSTELLPKHKSTVADHVSTNLMCDYYKRFLISLVTGSATASFNLMSRLCWRRTGDIFQAQTLWSPQSTVSMHGNCFNYISLGVWNRNG